MTRELAVVYGSYTVGTTSGSIGPDGKYRIGRSRERGYVEFSFVVTGSDAATFAANCVNTEVAFQKPYQDFAITIDGESLINAKQSTGTALDPIAEITKADHIADSGRSRHYTVRISFELPADTGAEPYSGLRDYGVDVRTDRSGIRTVSVNGTFTGVSGGGARAQYEAQIDTLIAGVLSALSISASNSEKLEVPSVRTNTNDTLCDFSYVLRELVFSQGGSSLDDSDLVAQQLSISRHDMDEGNTPETGPLLTLNLSYEANVDKDRTIDLESKYASIRSWLLSQITDVLGGGLFAVISEEPRYNRDDNRISASWVVKGQNEGSVVYENRVTVSDDDEIGIGFLPIWAGGDTDAYVYPKPHVVIRTVSHTQRRFGWVYEREVVQLLQPEVSAAKNRPAYQVGGGQFYLISRRPSAMRLRMGVGNDTMDVSEINLMTRMRYASQPGYGERRPIGGTEITPVPILR